MPVPLVAANRASAKATAALCIADDGAVVVVVVLLCHCWVEESLAHIASNNFNDGKLNIFQLFLLSLRR